MSRYSMEQVAVTLADDEHDQEDQDHRQLSAHEFEFSGRTEIDFINELSNAKKI